MHILDINATSVGAVMKPAGLEASKGVISVNYGKDPLDPTWKDDAGMKKYFEFMAKYYPDGDKDSNFNAYGYSTAQLLVHVLKACGDNLTRENVMKQATSLKNVAARPVAARHPRQHHAGRLPRQQAAADDEVQRRALGTVRPDPRRRRPGGLGLTSTPMNMSDRRPFGAADFALGVAFWGYFGISPKVLPTGSAACRIRRKSSTAACRCFTASR